MDLELAEAAGERDLLLIGDVLGGKDEQEMLEPGLVDPPEGFIIDMPQIDIADFRADQRVSPRQRDVIVRAAWDRLHP
jgi:hypothetical protein